MIIHVVVYQIFHAIRFGQKNHRLVIGRFNTPSLSLPFLNGLIIWKPLLRKTCLHFPISYLKTDPRFLVVDDLFQSTSEPTDIDLELVITTTEQRLSNFQTESLTFILQRRR